MSSELSDFFNLQITFISILYYRDLGEYIRRHHVEKRLLSRFYPDQIFKLDKFSGLLPSGKELPIHSYIKQLGVSSRVTGRKYNRHVLNRWHLIVMLANNKDLIRYRGHNYRKKRKHAFIEEKLLDFAKSCLFINKSAQATPRKPLLKKNQSLLSLPNTITVKI